MKATIFVKPLEYNLNADGEKWRQGDLIKGSLIIRNHSADNFLLPCLKVSLAAGSFKKVKLKDSRQWDYLFETTVADRITLGAQEEKEFLWNFKLPENCPITDKNGTVYLMFNDQDDSWPKGLLELGIEPKLVMKQFLEIFENFLRFKVVQTKFSKGMVEIKLNPPSSREFSHIESLVLRMKEIDKILDLEYNFNLQVFDATAGPMVVQKKIRKIEQKFTSKEYYIYGDSPNHDFIKTSIEAVIKEAAPRIFI